MILVDCSQRRGRDHGPGGHVGGRQAQPRPWVVPFPGSEVAKLIDGLIYSVLHGELHPPS